MLYFYAKIKIKAHKKYIKQAGTVFDIQSKNTQKTVTATLFSVVHKTFELPAHLNYI